MGKRLIIKGADFSINAILLDLESPVVASSSSGSTATVTITNPNTVGTIYYTTDGSTPSSQSSQYSSPFTVAVGTLIKAAVRYNGIQSETTTKTVWGLVTYGVTTIYDSVGGWPEVDYADGMGVGTWPLALSNADGVLKSITLSYARQKTGIVRIGAVDQNGNFIERTSHSVTILANSQETDLSSYNIAVRANEIVLFKCDSSGYAKYDSSTDPAKFTITKSSETSHLVQRTDSVCGTYFYKIQH